MTTVRLQFGPGGYQAPGGQASLAFLPAPWRPPIGTVDLGFDGPAYRAPSGTVNLQWASPESNQDGDDWEPAAGTVDLRFGPGEYNAPVGTAHLAFGQTDGDGGEPANVGTLAGTLAPPTGRLDAWTGVRGRIAATLPGPSAGGFQGVYDINVHRGPKAHAASAYQQGAARPASLGGHYRRAGQAHRLAASAYQQGRPQGQAVQVPAGQMPRESARPHDRYQQGARVGRQSATHNRHLPDARYQQGDTWQAAVPVRLATIWRNHYLPHLRTHHGLSYQQAAGLLVQHWGTPWQLGAWQPITTGSLYEQAMQPPPGMSYPPEPPGPPDPPPPFAPDLNLTICSRLPASLDLQFGVDPCDPTGPKPPVDVPIQRTYLVSNSASLTLVATGQALDASAISAAIDADSWAWELRATVIGEASIAAVRNAPQPCELEATLNGHTWRVVLDSWGRNRQFGEVPTITLSARSLAAYLGAAHAAPRSYAETQTRTARQLAEQELPLGWTLDWLIDDWLVEPEAWHYTNRTPIEAITAIAGAAGAVVQAHPSQPRLIIAPRYAVPHWAWGGATPDVTLPLDVLTRLGSELRSSEALNGVYVSGETTGVLALVKRTGTAADRLGEMVVDPLITRQAPARGRGIAVLSGSGAQTRESLALPLAADIAGLLATGQLVRVDPDGDDWRGLVRAVSLNAQLQGDVLTIDQSVELERHLEEIA